MNKLNAVKTVTTTIVAIGTGKIIGAIIQNNVHPETLTDKVAVTAGSFALGGMIADVTSAYTNEKIDELAALLQKLTKK